MTPTLPYAKTYKPSIIHIFRMLPSDPTGSLDDFFYNLSPQYDERNAGFPNQYGGVWYGG